MIIRRVAIGAVAVIALGGLGDRGLRIAAEHRVAKQTSCRLRAAHSTVGIGGFLLGPQILRDRYTHISIHSTDVPEPGGEVNLSAELYDVKPLSPTRLHAGHGQVTVTVPFTTIAAQAGKHVSATEAAGQLVFTSEDTADGTVGSTIYARVALEHDTVVVTPYKSLLAGKRVPWAKAKQTAARTGFSLAQRRVPLPTSLTDLGLRSASVTAAGLLLRAAGPNLTITLPDVAGC